MSYLNDLSGTSGEVSNRAKAPIVSDLTMLQASKEAMRPRLWVVFFAISAFIFAAARPTLGVTTMLVLVASLSIVLYIISMSPKTVENRVSRNHTNDFRTTCELLAGSFLIASILWMLISAIYVLVGQFLVGGLLVSIIAFAGLPIFIVIEGLLSAMLLFVLNRTSSDAANDFNNDLRIATMIDMKYGGILGAISR